MPSATRCRKRHVSACRAVDGGVNPRITGDDRKAGTRFAACDQPLLAIYRSDANGCPVALCQRRQPPKAGAVGQRLQRVAGQPSLTIKSDGWFPVAAGPPDPRAALCEDDLDSGTDSAPFMRGFSPPPTAPARRQSRLSRRHTILSDRALLGSNPVHGPGGPSHQRSTCPDPRVPAAIGQTEQAEDVAPILTPSRARAARA